MPVAAGLSREIKLKRKFKFAETPPEHMLPVDFNVWVQRLVPNLSSFKNNMLYLHVPLNPNTISHNFRAIQTGTFLPQFGKSGAWYTRWGIPRQS